MFSFATREAALNEPNTADRGCLTLNLITSFLIGYLTGGALLPVIIQVIAGPLL